jgi:hypothetical protein
MFDWLSAISLNERECKNFQVFGSVFRERVKPHGMLCHTHRNCRGSLIIKLLRLIIVLSLLSEIIKSFELYPTPLHISGIKNFLHISNLSKCLIASTLISCMRSIKILSTFDESL